MSATLLRFKVCVAATLIVWVQATCTLAESNKPGVSIDDIVKAWEARTKKVSTLRFKWSDSYRLRRGQALMPDPNGVTDPANPQNQVVPEQARTFEPFMSLVVDGDNIRYELKDLTLSLKQKLVAQQTAWVWSSEEYRHLYEPGGVHYPRGHVSQTILATWHPGDDAYLVPLLMTYRPFHPTLGVFEHFRQRFRVVTGTHVVNGRQCILLKDNPRPLSDIVVSLFLDPERDFVLMRQTLDAKGVECGRIEFLEYKQTDANWVLIRWKSTQVTGSIDGSHVSEFALNDPVDPKEFKLEFPAGTWVSETVSPTMYIVKEAGKRRIITRNELISGKKYEDFLKTDTGALARGPDTTNDEVARAEKLAEHRMQQLGDLKGRSLWSIPVIRQQDVEVRVEAVGTVNPREPIQVAIDDRSADQILFGKGRDQATARTQLAARVGRDIEAIDGICGLTDVQKQKLELAGRGDSDRLLRRTTELRQRIKKVFDETDVKKGLLNSSIVALCKEGEPLRREVSAESFESDSLFAKALKTSLTREQSEKYLRQRR
jgi:hypothetical protein